MKKFTSKHKPKHRNLSKIFEKITKDPVTQSWDKASRQDIAN